MIAEFEKQNISFFLKKKKKYLGYKANEMIPNIV